MATLFIQSALTLNQGEHTLLYHIFPGHSYLPTSSQIAGLWCFANYACKRLQPSYRAKRLGLPICSLQYILDSCDFLPICEMEQGSIMKSKSILLLYSLLSELYLWHKRTNSPLGLSLLSNK